MEDDLFICDDASLSQATDPWAENSQYAPTPGNLGYSPAYSYNPSPQRILPPQPPDRLMFLPWAEWDKDREYDVQLP
jgi:hypothetical protein